MRSLHHIYSIRFLTWIEFVKRGIAIKFLQFILDTIMSRIHSFLLLHLNGTILKIRTQEVSQSFKNLLDFIRPCANSIFNIHKPYGIKLLTRFHPGIAFLGIAFKILWIHYVTVVTILKQQHSFFSNAQASTLLDKPSWIILQILTHRFYLMPKIS